MTSVRAATKSFEHWLAGETLLIARDLKHKHAAMSADVFSFFRATCYRWAQQFDSLPSVLTGAPKVLSVGDLHLENFGTWRDEFGRLAWGVNDFDEAFPLPYTNDLLRLATSVLLVIDQEHLTLSGKIACRAIVAGYRDGLAAGGRPFVIGDDHRWFKPILEEARDPGKFWDKLTKLPRETGSVPATARSAISRLMPEPKLRFELHHRIAGLGNLGKPRYTATADWCGGPVAREAKALTRSAVAWARGKGGGPFFAKILAGAVRSPDPFLAVIGSWLVRRLAPDCQRIDLNSLIRVKDEELLLHAMGFETANVHLGTPGSQRSIQQHLADQPKGWLRRAATRMRDAVMKDFQDWSGAP